MPALMRVEIQFSNHGMADPRHREPVILFSTTQRVLTWSLHIGGLCTTPFFVERHFCDSHLPMSSHGLDKLSIGLSGTSNWELIKKTGTNTTRTSTNTETYASISKVLHLDKTYAITRTQLNLMSLTSGRSGCQV